MKIKNNLINKLNSLNIQLNNYDFNFKFYNDCNKKINEIIKKVKIKNSIVKGFLLSFTMSGNIEMLKMAYYSGIGNKNSMGFGFII